MTSSTDQRVADLIVRLDSMPSPPKVAAALGARAFVDAVRATESFTIADLASLGAVSASTVREHVRRGILPGRVEKVRGVNTWLFRSEDALLYLESLAALIERAVHRKKNRPTKIIAPAGYLTVPEAAAACCVSHWTLREHLLRCGAEIGLGLHGAKLIAETSLPQLHKYFATLKLPRSLPKGSPRAPAKGQIPGGPYFSSFEILWAVLSTQPETDAAGLATATGATVSAARRWLNQERLPSIDYRGALIALFRERFRCRLSPDLMDAAQAHRALYTRETMRAPQP